MNIVEIETMYVPKGYTNRTAVEHLLNRTFSEVTDSEFNTYLALAENQVEDFLGYTDNNTNAGVLPTTSSGILTQVITRERSMGKLDSFGNLVIHVKHGPVHMDSSGNPLVTGINIYGGAYDIPLQITNGNTTGLTTFMILDDQRRTVIYPAQYVIAAISSITPTAKIAFTNLRSLRFWTDISYTGGFDDVPPAISQATAFLAADSLILRDNVNQVEQFSQGSMSVTYIRRAPTAVKARAGEPSAYQKLAYQLLQPYARVTW